MALKKRRHASRHHGGKAASFLNSKPMKPTFNFQDDVKVFLNNNRNAETSETKIHTKHSTMRQTFFLLGLVLMAVYFLSYHPSFDRKPFVKKHEQVILGLPYIPQVASKSNVDEAASVKRDDLSVSQVPLHVEITEDSPNKGQSSQTIQVALKPELMSSTTSPKPLKAPVNRNNSHLIPEPTSERIQNPFIRPIEDRLSEHSNHTPDPIPMVIPVAIPHPSRSSDPESIRGISSNPRSLTVYISVSNNSISNEISGYVSSVLASVPKARKDSVATNFSSNSTNDPATLEKFHCISPLLNVHRYGRIPEDGEYLTVTLISLVKAEASNLINFALYHLTENYRPITFATTLLLTFFNAIYSLKRSKKLEKKINQLESILLATLAEKVKIEAFDDSQRSKSAENERLYSNFNQLISQLQLLQSRTEASIRPSAFEGAEQTFAN